MMQQALSAARDDAVADALLAALRDNSDVQAVFGQPSRLFDAQTEGGYYPYAVLEQHHSGLLETSEVETIEHKITLATYSRFGGLVEAKQLLSTLRHAIAALSLQLPGQAMVLAHPIYCDVMRKPDQRTFRGLIRIRIIMEVSE